MSTDVEGQLLTAIILTYNEEIHISRCISSVKRVADRVIVVDSFSTDRTEKIALDMGVEIIKREFVNQAEQFQWALDHLNITSLWVLRIDADEYLEPILIAELPGKLKSVGDDVGGVYLNRKHIFWGKWIRHGGRYPLYILRIWRTGQAHIEQRWMDEHTVLSAQMNTINLDGLVDDNLKGLNFWVNKVNGYSSREALEVLNMRYHLVPSDESILKGDTSQAKFKRIVKEKVYSRLPLGLRSGLYFLFRYFIQLGFLDGRKGFVYHFLQGFWYRYLVDVKVQEIEAEALGDVEAMKRLFREKHGIKIN